VIGRLEHGTSRRVQNREHEGYRTMNSDLIMNGKVKSPVGPDWQRQFEEWRELLSKCGQKPNRKRVHALRVASLRLKAEVDFLLLDHANADRSGDVAELWKKHADKLRKTLSPVRDTDIHLEMLRKMRGARDAKGSQLTPERVREIERLEDRLLEKRASAEKELLAEIDDRQTRLERSSKKLQDSLAARTPWTESDRIRVIRGLIAGLASELPSLSADNLHEFRKQAKTARYLADVAKKNDPYAARQAALLKKVQNAAGEWHDLQTLAIKAEQVLETSDGLVAVLKTQSDEALKRALELCPRVTAQLLDRGARNGVSTQTMPSKKPVRSAEPLVEKRDKRYA
jgi:CHAD domain-containing protein